VVSSLQLADIVGDALGIPRQSAQLHLKTIRAARQISFKGFGQSAAAMTPLDASRLLIAAAGSYFAKDSARVLERFGKLKPMGRRSRPFVTLEECVAQCIGDLLMKVPNAEKDQRSQEWHERFNATQLAETALQLLDPMPKNDETDKLSRFAIVRWIDKEGTSEVVAFGSPGEKLGRGTDIRDLLDLYSAHRFFQVRIVRRQTLIDIGAALKGVPADYGNALGNTR
jgi:hypothetical protein